MSTPSVSKQREAVERARRIAEERAKSLREERARLGGGPQSPQPTVATFPQPPQQQQHTYYDPPRPALHHHHPVQQQQQQAPTWPDSLKLWLERSLQQTQHDQTLNNLMQEKLRLEVQMAVEHNVIWTTNWDAIPPLAIPPEWLVPTRTPSPPVTLTSSPVEQQPPPPFTNAPVSRRQLDPPPRVVPSVFDDDDVVISRRTVTKPLLLSSTIRSRNKDVDNNNNNTNYTKRPYVAGQQQQQQQQPMEEEQVIPLRSSKKRITSTTTTTKLAKPARNSKSSSQRSSANTVPLGSLPTPSPPVPEIDIDHVYKTRAERAQRFTTTTDPTNNPSNTELTGTERTYLAAERVARARREAEMRGEELDFASLVIKGTSEQLEKPYLRLTSAPDPSTIRPVHVLERSLEHVKRKMHESGSTALYDWASEQFKSMRQDLTVQHVKSKLTLDVYEAHARCAILFGGPDFREFNQCVTQLLVLFDEGLGSSFVKNEFRAYTLLYHVFTLHAFRSVASAITLSSAVPQSNEEIHALTVWQAVELGDWKHYFVLRKSAPNLGAHFMGSPLADIVRKKALDALCKTFRPSLPVEYVKMELDFTGDTEEEKDWKELTDKVIKEEGAGGVFDTKQALQRLWE